MPDCTGCRYSRNPKICKACEEQSGKRQIYHTPAVAPFEPSGLPSLVVKGKGRTRTPGMNKAETAYASHLEELRTLGEVLWYKYEGMTFKLAHDTRYTPDFAVLMAGGDLQMHEVKAYWKERPAKGDKPARKGHPHFEDDAKAKIRIAADMFPLQFIAVWQKDGLWEREEF